MHREAKMAVEIPTFGLRLPNENYVKRPGAYAIALDGHGKCAVVQTRKGCYLLGGGINVDENPEDALCREILEESGRSATVLTRIGDAVEYLLAPGEGYFAICGSYFHIELGDQVVVAKEDGHQLVWLATTDALRLLTRESAKWALGEVVGRDRLSPLL